MSTVPSPFTSVAYTENATLALAVMSCSVKLGLGVSPPFRNSRTLSSVKEATKMSTVPSPLTSVAYTECAPYALAVMSCSVKAEMDGVHRNKTAAKRKASARDRCKAGIGDLISWESVSVSSVIQSAINTAGKGA